jgi:hypothetical protein
MANSGKSGAGTPGPWEWSEGGHRLLHNVPASHSSTVLVIHDPVWQPTDADRALIAAAPELLEALESVERVVLEQRCERGTPWDLACVTIAQKVREFVTPAIAKAQGQPS